MNVPKLRFKEFDGEWEEKKIGGFFDHLSTGSTPSRTNPDYFKGEIPWISSGELKSHYISDTKEHVSELAVKETNLKIHPPGTFFIAITGLEAKGTRSSAAINTVPMTTNQSCLAFKPNDLIDLNFLYFWYKKNGERIGITYTQGTKQQSLTPGLVRDLDITVPKIEEQKYISRFFNIVEKKIQLQQQKIDLLQEQKKGFLQKMFPKAGETQPEMRFDGYKDNWKQKKLEEVTSRVKGNDGRMELPTLTISASQGWLDQRERFSANIAGKEQKNYTLLKKGQLSYNHGNSKLAKYGVVFELDAYEEALVPRVYHSFETNNFADSKFIQYMFETKRTDKELAKLISSGARMDGLLNINYDEFMGITVSIPDIKEQKKIAEFFIMLNEKINREKEKVRELEKQKQGFMQQMFI